MPDEIPSPQVPADQALPQWQRLSTLLDALRQGHAGVQAFSAGARSQQALLGALPARYGTVLHDLLDRLESSALFAEESCSFSRKDLMESLQMWLDKARQQLPR